MLGVYCPSVIDNLAAVTCQINAVIVEIRHLLNARMGNRNNLYIAFIIQSNTCSL
jgi:hypothetical protein